MKKFLLILIAILAFPMVSQASVIPDFPMAFWGAVTIDGQKAPIGTEIRVYYGDVLAGDVFVKEIGIYGYTEPTKQKLTVGEGSGQINFKFKTPSINGGNETSGFSPISYAGFTSGTTLQKDLNFVVTPNVDTATEKVIILETAITKDLTIDSNLVSAETAQTDAYEAVSSLPTGTLKTSLTPRFNTASGIVTNASIATDKNTLTDELIKGSNPDLLHVTTSLTNPLPSKGLHGTGISWVSSNVAVVSNDGQTINRPAFANGDATSTLTATLGKGISYIFDINSASTSNQGGGGGGAMGGGYVGTTKVFNLNILKLAEDIVPPTPTTNTPVLYSGGGGGGGSSSSGGSYVPVTTSISTTSTSTLSTIATTGKVLGASIFKFTKTLKKGVTSDDVKELQDRLRTEKFFALPSSTRFFGSVTFNAVKKYQKAHKLPSTGLVGPLTIAELNK